MLNSIPSHTHCTLPLPFTHIPPTHTQPPPQLKPFNVEQFLKGVEGAGPHLTSGIKGNWAGLYRYLASFRVLCTGCIMLRA